MSLDERPVCPHCQKVIPPGMPYCPACGYRIDRVEPYAGDDHRSPFNGMLVFCLIFIIPLAVFGGCSILVSKIDSIFFPALGLELASVGLGLVMAFANLIAWLTRKR